MKKIIYFLAVIAIVSSSTAYAGGVLMKQWTEGMDRFCRYSDGEVVKIDFNSVCEATR